MISVKKLKKTGRRKMIEVIATVLTLVSFVALVVFLLAAFVVGAIVTGGWIIDSIASGRKK